MYILLFRKKKRDDEMKIDVVIPVFRPDGRLKMCIERLLRQSVTPDRIYLDVLYENPVDKEIPEVYMDERIEARYMPRFSIIKTSSKQKRWRNLQSLLWRTTKRKYSYG